MPRTPQLLGSTVGLRAETSGIQGRHANQSITTFRGVIRCLFIYISYRYNIQLLLEVIAPTTDPLFCVLYIYEVTIYNMSVVG
jgi:hypothetical protein